MPILQRYSIERYKEILTNQPAGLVQDGSFSTYTLDDPTITPNGTGDFLGVIKTIVLLGEVYRETIDTGNLSFNQFNNLTQQEFDNLVANGTILRNPRTNGIPERIGWVQIAKSYASFYYQSCFNGKRPTSQHYYDIQEFAFDNRIVVGDGSEVEPTIALNPIGNFDPNIVNNMGVLRPRFDPLTLAEYVRFALTGNITNNDGETARINDLALTDQTRPSQVSLLLANRGDHFDNQFAIEISPGRWGVIRRTIDESLTPGVHTINNNLNLDFAISEGECLPTTTTVVPPPPVTGGDEENEDDYVIEFSTDESDLDPQLVEGGDIDDNYQLKESDLKSCSRMSGLPVKLYSNGVYLGDAEKTQFGNTDNLQPGFKEAEVLNDRDVTYIQSIPDMLNKSEGITDERIIGGNSTIYPRGTLKSLLNVNDCVIEVHENYRDKDGNIPEYVGPIVENYHESVRKNMMSRFFTSSPLTSIGYGTDGYEYYSDGNSYLELHGESVFGCGPKFSFADIPEIFNDLYRQPVPNVGPIKFGQDERFDVKFYRKTFERPTQIPLATLKILDWLTGLPARLTEDRQTVTDLFNDFVFGIPDLDFATVGKDENDETFKQILYAAIGAGIGASVAYWVSSDLKGFQELPTGEVGPPTPTTNWSNLIRNIDLGTKFTIGGALAGYTISQMIKDEEQIYKETWSVNSQKPRPKTISRYRSFNSFWSRDGLKNVYSDTNPQNVIPVKGKRKTITTPEGETFLIDENGNQYTVQADGTLVNDNGDVFKIDKNNNIVDITGRVITEGEDTFISPGETISDYDTVVWEGKTLKNLRITQAKLGYASRWKAMTRPLYSELWHDADEIKPENVSTRKYFGEGLLELELGDYKSHRQKYGMSKNLYDHIDDAISIRVSEDRYKDEIPYELLQFSTIENSIKNIGPTIRGLLTQKSIDMGRYDTVTQYQTVISDLMNESQNLDSWNSYIELARRLVDSYELFANAPSTVQSKLTELERLGAKLANGVDRLSVDYGYMGVLFEGIEEFIEDFTRDLSFQLVSVTVEYVVTSFLQMLSEELNRTNPERSSFTPRRVFKKGSVYLRSKSGLYFTNKQPCPIIFLGFNDSIVMSSFTEAGKQLDCLGTLNKVDNFDTIKYVNPRYNPFLEGSRSSTPIIQSLQQNLGSIAPQMDSYKNVIDSVKVQMRKDTVPTINKRLRQYGRNPLLDIFYLNLIPEYVANNPNSVPYTHRTSTPMPIRYSNTNERQQLQPGTAFYDKSRVFVKDYSQPSYFPPYWNEPRITEGSPGQYYRDQAMMKHGDGVFMNRQPSTIIPAKDRWVMKLQPIGTENVVVLEDKTRILDIYFGLLQLHIYGMDWKELTQYIKEAKSAIKIGTDEDPWLQGGYQVASHLKSSINLDQLEKLWTKIEARLNYTMPLYISADTFWDKVDPIYIDDVTGEFGLMSILQDKTVLVKEGKRRVSPEGEFLDEDKPVTKKIPSEYKRVITLMNNTPENMVVKQINIVPIGENNLDTFGQDTTKMFFVGDTLTPNTSTQNIVDLRGNEYNIQLPPFNPVRNDFKYITVWFVPYGAQHGVTYTANLEIVVDIKGEEYRFTQKLVASVENKSSVKNWKRELLTLPVGMTWGRITDITLFDVEQDGITTEFKNDAKENILIERMEIIDEVVLDENENNVTDTLNSPPNFFVFDKDESEDETQKSILVNKIIPKQSGDDPLDFQMGPKIFVNRDGIMKTNNFKPNLIYFGLCRVTFSLAPRLGSSERVTKTQTFRLSFSSIE